MPFIDTNSHWATKPNNFDIKYQWSSESYDWHNFVAPSLRGVRFFIYGGRFFQQQRVLWGWLAGPPLKPVLGGKAPSFPHSPLDSTPSSGQRRHIEQPSTLHCRNFSPNHEILKKISSWNFLTKVELCESFRFFGTTFQRWRVKWKPFGKKLFQYYNSKLG